MGDRKAINMDLERGRSKRLLFGFILLSALLCIILQLPVPKISYNLMAYNQLASPKESMVPITIQQPLKQPVTVREQDTYSDPLPSNEEYNKIAQAETSSADEDAGTSSSFVVVTTHFSVQFSQHDEEAIETSVHQDMNSFMPLFPGGELALLSFISHNIHYPESAQESGMQGRVIVQFSVNSDGSVSDASVLKGSYSILNREALRVINMMPHWRPAMQDGKPIKMRYSVPVNFKLRN